MTHFADLGKLHVAYDTFGKGQPLLLIHGAEANRFGFRALADMLSSTTLVVSYDQRGCGETQSPADEAHTMFDLADDAVQLMETLGHRRFAVFGTSFGGRIAQVLALNYPERIARLVLCNTWPLDLTLADAMPTAAARLQALRAGLPSTGRELAELFYSADYVSTHPEIVERYSQSRPSARRAELTLEHYNMAPRTIVADTLLLSGGEDALVPTHVMRDFQKSIAHGTLQVLAGVGHAASSQAPDAVAQAILEFMSVDYPRVPLTHDIDTRSVLAASRRTIDDIDDQICALLARRFEATDEVGRCKARIGEPARDPERQLQRASYMEQLAARHALEPALLDEIFGPISREAVRRHIASGAPAA